MSGCKSEQGYFYIQWGGAFHKNVQLSLGGVWARGRRSYASIFSLAETPASVRNTGPRIDLSKCQYTWWFSSTSALSRNWFDNVISCCRDLPKNYQFNDCEVVPTAVALHETLSVEKTYYCMMTSSKENILHVTGHLCGEFTGHRWIPAQRPVTRSFDVFFDLRLNKRLSKQSWGWWFGTLSCPLWRHRNGTISTQLVRRWIRDALWYNVLKR